MEPRPERRRATVGGTAPADGAATAAGCRAPPPVPATTATTAARTATVAREMRRRMGETSWSEPGGERTGTVVGEEPRPTDGRALVGFDLLSIIVRSALGDPAPAASFPAPREPAGALRENRHARGDAGFARCAKWLVVSRSS